MPAACVGNDSQHRTAFTRYELRADADVGIALLAQGVLRTIAFGEVISAIKSPVDCLLSLAVHNAQNLPALDDGRPWLLRRYHQIEHRRDGVTCAHAKVSIVTCTADRCAQRRVLPPPQHCYTDRWRHKPTRDGERSRSLAMLRVRLPETDADNSRWRRAHPSQRANR